MKKEEIQDKIESKFRKKVQSDKNIRNAYLLVHSEKLGIHLNLAEGETEGQPANPQQPHYMASVGKIFTATLIGIFHDQGKLSFDDPIAKYLDTELMNGLNVFKGTDYSGDIKICHLLNQSSGLNDVFYHLLEKIKKNPETITPRAAVIWGKNNLKPKGKPGEKHFYTDTNYFLLGLIVENITKMPFHASLHKFIFEPLGMQHAFMQGYSEPKVKSGLPKAGFYIKGLNPSTVAGFYDIDYAGGGVVATSEEYMIFMKALVNNRLVKPVTLQRMLLDDKRSMPNFRYGYAIWKTITIPLLLPEKYNCWGCAGATGAYLFYHPKTETFLVINFNDFAYRSKAFVFLLRKVIRELLKYS
ncbi:MAG: beta-lactamase family protein [Bacteroidales bacterium]|nr:beta-lactamase family protein [Bacteroidales bacterium]